MSGPHSWAFLLAAIAGCKFDPAGVHLTDPDAVFPIDSGPDSSLDHDGPLLPVDASVPDATHCPEPIVVAVQVNGIESPVPDPGDLPEPTTRVLVGDTVFLSSTGSCVRAAPASFSWSIVSPADGTAGTAKDYLTDPAISLFPFTSGTTYTVSLTVTDASTPPNVKELKVFFETASFEELGDGLDVRDLAIGGGKLWIASPNGPWAMSLAAPGLLSHEDAPAPVEHVAFDSPSRVWVSAPGNREVVWRLDGDTWTEVRFSDVPVEVRDLAPWSEGIGLASSLGIAQSNSGGTGFSWLTPSLEGDIWTLLDTEMNRFAAGDAVWDLAAAEADLLPFGAGDQEARVLTMSAVDGHEWLWIGSSARGLIRLFPDTGAKSQIYSAGNGLPSNDVRALAVLGGDSLFDQDVWIATSVGLARWKGDRGTVATLMVAGSGDARSLVVDEDSGRRAIYLGTSAGLFYTHLP